VVLDFEREVYAERGLREVLKVIRSADKILVELADDLGIQFESDGSMLTTVHKQSLFKECLATGCDASKTVLPEVCEVIGSNDEMLPDVAADLGIDLGFYDEYFPLTSERRQALLNQSLAWLGYDGFDTVLCKSGRRERAQ
jgi:hypothetical protein